MCRVFYCRFILVPFYVMLMDVLPTWMSVYHGNLGPQRPKEGIRPSTAGVVDGHEPPCGFWESSPGPLQSQPVFLTTKPSLQPHHWPLDPFSHSLPDRERNLLSIYWILYLSPKLSYCSQIQVWPLVSRRVCAHRGHAADVGRFALASSASSLRAPSSGCCLSSNHDLSSISKSCRL